MSLKITGLDKLQDKLKDMQRSASALHGTRTVPISELLTPGFVRKHSRFSSADELFTASGFKVESQEDFEKIPDLEWDAFISNSTTFRSWKEMLNAAGADYAKKQLGFE